MRRGQHLLARNPYASTQQRCASSAAGSGGVAKFVTLSAVAGAAGAAGVIGYAAYDPSFRNKVGSNVPYSGKVFESILGPSERQLKVLNKDVAIPSIAYPLQSPTLLPHKSSDEPEKKKKIEKSPPPEKFEKKETRVQRSSKTVNPYLGQEDSEKRNEGLKIALSARLDDAEKGVREASEAKYATIRAIEFHVQALREAIEAKDGGSDWDRVTEAHLKAEKLAAKDKDVERKARNLLEDVLVEANLAAQGETTMLNPLIPLSRATVAKHRHQLDQICDMVKKVDTEKIFARDYGELVDASRKKFALEYRAVVPTFEWDEGAKMKKGQLSALLTHAHLRVDQLSRQLIEQKMREEETVRKLVEEKRKAYSEKLKSSGAVVAPNVVEKDQKRFDEELKAKLDEAQKKYDTQLELVVKTQKQLYDIEHAEDVGKAVAVERNKHRVCIEKALAQLQGIEFALKGHLAMDIENRRSKQMWLAAQNLVETIEFGNRGSCCMEGRRAPLGAQMKVLTKVGEGDEFLKTIDNAMSKVTKVKGEYAEDDLDTRFEKVYRVGRRVAWVDESSGGGVVAHLFSWLRSAVSFSLPHRYTRNDLVSPASESNFALLNRAAAYWDEGNTFDAIRVLQLTRGATRRVAKDFIEDARRHEEALLLARLLLAHVALTSIRSTY